MTMRKHKIKQNVGRLPRFDTAQLRTTLAWHGKLLGLGSMTDNFLRKIDRQAEKLAAEKLKTQRRMYHASGGKQAFDIPVADMTPLDKARIARAKARRQHLQDKRTRAYALCVQSNPALRREEHAARVRISNVNYVDKAFLVKWRGRPA
jgi:hypothetical protein